MTNWQKPLIDDYEVSTTSDTRANLTKILARFRNEGKKAKPILFGSHRKAEAVLVPVKVWKKLINELDDLKLELTVSERLNNSQDGHSTTYEQFRIEMQALVNKKRELEDASRNKDEGL